MEGFPLIAVLWHVILVQEQRGGSFVLQCVASSTMVFDQVKRGTDVQPKCGLSNCYC